MCWRILGVQTTEGTKNLLNLLANVFRLSESEAVLTWKLENRYALTLPVALCLSNMKLSWMIMTAEALYTLCCSLYELHKIHFLPWFLSCQAAILLGLYLLFNPVKYWGHDCSMKVRPDYLSIDWVRSCFSTFIGCIRISFSYRGKDMKVLAKTALLYGHHGHHPCLICMHSNILCRILRIQEEMYRGAGQSRAVYAAGARLWLKLPYYPYLLGADSKTMLQSWQPSQYACHMNEALAYLAPSGCQYWKDLDSQWHPCLRHAWEISREHSKLSSGIEALPDLIPECSDWTEHSGRTIKKLHVLGRWASGPSASNDVISNLAMRALKRRMSKWI